MWSYATFLNAHCGASLGGMTILGTPGGVYTKGLPEDVNTFNPKMVVETPMLWMGSMASIKQSYSLLTQATGIGTLKIEAFDDEGRSLSSEQIEIEENDQDDVISDIPLSKQYERKFEHRFRGIRLRFTIEGRGLMRLLGFAILVRAEK